jgi:hypothetical protein
MIDRDLKKHRAEFARYMANKQYEVSDEGIYFPKAGAVAKGVYTHDVNGSDVRIDSNLVTTEGFNHILDVVLHDASKISTWYFAMFTGNVTPLVTWTAANFTANATELTSNTEGYSESVRQTFVESAASAGAINNTASKAAFTIATATSVIVRGAALVSSNTKGGTTGTLYSAADFSAPGDRSVVNGDTLTVTYTLSLAG